MLKPIRTLGFALLAFSVAGCHLIYTPDVQQGNLLDKKNVDQLKPGMTKRQVLVLLGTPSVTTPFDQNRWDYVSTFSHRGEKMVNHTLSLTFNNDVLVRTDGDFFATDAQQLLKDTKKYHASYPVDENQGDKNTGSGGDKDKKDDGSSGGDSGKSGDGSSGNGTH